MRHTNRSKKVPIPPGGTSLAIYPGSFDPITNGHIDILWRALKVFPKIILLVANSDKKKPLLNVEERLDVISQVIADEKLSDRVLVDQFDGLVVDYARHAGATALIRGLRAASDFEYEFMMASMNREINSNIETLFMMTGPNLYFVSSSMIKELYRFNGDITRYVPKAVINYLKTRK